VVIKSDHQVEVHEDAHVGNEIPGVRVVNCLSNPLHQGGMSMRINVAAILLSICLLPALSYAQSVEDFDIYVSGGIAVPYSSNDFSKYYHVDTSSANIKLPSLSFSGKWTPAFNIGLGLGYSVTPSLSFIADVNYDSFSLDKASFLKGIGLTGNEYMDDASLKMVSLNINAKYVFPQPGLFFDPYVIGGVGYMSVAASDISALLSAYSDIGATFETQNALNTSLGVGIDIRGGQSSSFYFDVKYDVSYTRSASPFSSDNFGFFPIRIGFRGKF